MYIHREGFVVFVTLTQFCFCMQATIEKTLDAIEEEHKLSGTREIVPLMEMFRSPYYRRVLIVVVLVFAQCKSWSFVDIYLHVQAPSLL